MHVYAFPNADLDSLSWNKADGMFGILEYILMKHDSFITLNYNNISIF
jgi:hypothetical protein